MTEMPNAATTGLPAVYRCTY